MFYDTSATYILGRTNPVMTFVDGGILSLRILVKKNLLLKLLQLD